MFECTHARSLAEVCFDCGLVLCFITAHVLQLVETAINEYINIIITYRLA